MSIINTLLRKISRRKDEPIIDVQAERVKPWFEVNGDKTLRLDYDLKKDSVVFDLGGYEGQWASDIYARYLSEVHVFEPMPDYAAKIKSRFKRNPDIHIYPFGLAEKNKTVGLSVENDASSIIKSSGHTIKVRLKDVNGFIEKAEVKHIDLMKINIEGGEYDLLDRLIESGQIAKVKNIQVQFHDFFPEAEARMAKIQNELKKTHRLTYQYPFVWENWERL